MTMFGFERRFFMVVLISVRVSGTDSNGFRVVWLIIGLYVSKNVVIFSLQCAKYAGMGDVNGKSGGGAIISRFTFRDRSVVVVSVP